MRLRQILESMGDDPYRDTDLKLSNYRGPYNPRDENLSPYGDDFDSVTDLWDIVEDLIEDGVQPKRVDARIDTLLATQDWLSDEPGDGPLFDDYGDRPVVLDYDGKRFILDGHNRISRAKSKGKDRVSIYYFSKAA